MPGLMWLAKQKHLQPSHRLLLTSTFRFLFLTTLRFSPASAAACGDPARPPEEPHFMVDYFVRSCGLSRAEATKASRSLLHLKSTEKPDAALHLLRQEGLDDAHIRRLIRTCPDVLVSDPKRTLQPKIAALRGAGFSGPELAQLISFRPDVLRRRNVLPRMAFWRELTGSNQNLLKAIQRNPSLLSHRLEERAIPNLSLLRGLAISEDRIGLMILRKPRMFTRSVGQMRALVEQVKTLGSSPDSGMFPLAMCTISSLSRSTVDAKFRLLRSFGWTQAEFTTAFRRFPTVFCLSQDRIVTAMNFLLEEAGCKPSYVASHPVLLNYSIEKRLMPRYRVLRSLKMKGLPRGDNDLHNAIALPKKKFIDRYILPNREKCPELLEVYLADSAKSSSS